MVPPQLNNSNGKEMKNGSFSSNRNVTGLKRNSFYRGNNGTKTQTIKNKNNSTKISIYMERNNQTEGFDDKLLIKTSFEILKLELSKDSSLKVKHLKSTFSVPLVIKRQKLLKFQMKQKSNVISQQNFCYYL